MAAPVSEIDLYTALRPKLGDTEARDTARTDQACLGIRAEVADLKRLLIEQSAAAKLDRAALRAELQKELQEQLRWLVLFIVVLATVIIVAAKL